MIDPFRGERTAKYVQQERLEWAARERLLRQVKPAAQGKKHDWPHITVYLIGLLQRHRALWPRPRHQPAH